MKLLILGGTKFLGRHLTEAALARGHEVTLFNRGLSNPDLFREVEQLRGDRDGGLDALRGREWDAVVDPSGFVPRVVRASAELLKDAVGLYVFISSQSVYADFSGRVDEETAVGKLEDESVEDPGGRAYGPLKALCERAAEEVMPGRVLSVRAGLIVGPYDPTGRFSYWTRRVAQGGEVLAPGDPERQVQFIDARDLAAWLLLMAESRRGGVFNATGPDYRLTMGRFLEVCREVGHSEARINWVDEKFLIERGVEPWGELPLWLTSDNAGFRNFLAADNSRALSAGLTFRPLAETVRDTLDWQKSGEPPTTKDGVPVPDATLKPERERELLEEWDKRTR
ncbi:MAG TPA: SDR family oxidoreductase [Pyrinomonadaceae bacterium]|nr:SDR family oxidoreductase [Pyrinomonadaceae bacterium]